MELIKVLAVCLIAAVPIVLLKQYKAEYALLCALAACAVIVIMLSAELTKSIQHLYAICEQSENVAGYFKTALKALGIAYITSFVADMCRDFGQTALASKAELAGKLAIFTLAIPLLQTLLDLALRFMQ